LASRAFKAAMANAKFETPDGELISLDIDWDPILKNFNDGVSATISEQIEAQYGDDWKAIVEVNDFNWGEANVSEELNEGLSAVFVDYSEQMFD
jgi:hypothetical protein